jgi:hypothetical protein
MTIKSGVEELTPEAAREILEGSKDVNNRTVADSHVTWLAGQMKAGKWMCNGEPIILDEDGQLLDGQHRLWAVMESGVNVKTMVTRGISRAAFATIDTGYARTSANVLGMSGEQNVTVLAAALGWVWRHESGKMMWPLKTSGYTSMIGLGLLRKHPGLKAVVTWAVSARHNVVLKNVTISALAFLRFMFEKHKPQKAAEFFSLVGDEAQDQAGTPTRVLRDRILTLSSGTRRTAKDVRDVMAMFIKAWDAFLNGARPQKILWRRIGLYPEDFPVIPGEGESKGKAMKARGVSEEKLAARRQARKR